MVYRAKAPWLGAPVPGVQRLWHIPEQGPDFPWWGFKAEDRFTLKLRDEVSALLQLARYEEARSDYDLALTLGPHQEGHVDAAFDQPAAVIAADGAGAEHQNPHDLPPWHFPLPHASGAAAGSQREYRIATLLS